MSRTAHHRRATIRTLRYSVSCLAEAERAGVRPSPRPVRRAVRVDELARELAHGDYAEDARIEERRERAALRGALTLARALVTASGDPDAADAVVLPSGRHRRNVLWSV